MHNVKQYKLCISPKVKMFVRIQLILMKKNGIRDLMIDIYIKKEQEQLELFRYTKDWYGVTRRIYEVGESYLTETDKDMKFADGLKLMKKDFLYCKEWMKQTVLDLILDEKEEDIA